MEFNDARALIDGGFTIQPTLEERATGHFISQFVLGIQAPSRESIDNLAFMYRYNTFDNTLAAAVRAISLASFAHANKSGELDDRSRVAYTQAISLTNDALRMPDRSTQDSVLLSIMILGMYEVLTGTNQKSVQAWIHHVRGSCALLKLRGYKQLQTPLGRRLFVQASTSILTTSLQLNIPIPKDIMQMVQSLAEHIPPNDNFSREAYEVHRLMLTVNQYRAAVRRGKAGDLSTQLAKALQLDQRLEAHRGNGSLEWQYDTVSLATDESFVYKRTYHIYTNILVANMWNAMRVHRGLLWEHIRRTLLEGFSAKPPVFTAAEHTELLQNAMDILYGIQGEILSSVPQHLGYVAQTAAWKQSGSYRPVTNGCQAAGIVDSSRESGPTSHVADSATHKPVRSTAPASGGLNVMWPLYYAGTMEIATDEAREYCVRSLRDIGERLGIRQAFVLAKVVESKSDVEPWGEMPLAVDDDPE